MQILAIAGSLRAGSYNRQLLELARTVLPSGVELVAWEKLGEVPAYDEDVEGHVPAVVADLRAHVRDAAGVLIATPEYNGSIPGSLKNALDWASRPTATGAFRGKPVAVIGASTGAFGGVWAQGEARKVLGLMGARVVAAELAVGHAAERLAEPDEQLLEQLREAIELLVAEMPSDDRDADSGLEPAPTDAHAVAA